MLTCAWHNWKFRVTDGSCLLGQEGVRVHDVDVDDDGAVRVVLNRPEPADVRVSVTASLRRGIERDDVGQVSRDVVRLLRADAEPADIMWEAVAHGAPRAEDGWGHSIAAAADCLAMVDLFEGDQRALPIVQGITAISESERDRPVRELPAPTSDRAAVTAAGFRAAVEREALADAQAILRAAIQRGDSVTELRPWFETVVSDHHLSYGHGAIYSQKAFELLDMVGWERADTVLPHLVPTIVHGTRENTLPYMRPFMRALATVDLAQLGAIEADPGWVDDGCLSIALLGSDRTAPVHAVADAFRDGAGVHGVLDSVVDAVCERMLRYDLAGDFDVADDFGWLDITHGVTYAHAARWHHDARRASAGATGVGPPTTGLIRLVFFTAFLAHWTGRHEWHTAVGERDRIEPLAHDVGAYGDELQRRSLRDGTTAFIFNVHAVKMARASAIEGRRRDTALPLDATARFITSPKLERRVAATVHRSIDFVAGRLSRN